MQYSFILKSNGQKAYRQFTWFLFFLHIVAVDIVGLNSAGKSIKQDMYITLGLYIITFIVYYFSRHRKKAFEYFSFIMAVLYGIFWLKYVGVVAFLIFAAIYFFAIALRQKKNIAWFSSTGIHLKRALKTIIYPWRELDNVILKDDLLTIDLKSNKLIQVELAAENEEADEERFNSFCREQLQANA